MFQATFLQGASCSLVLNAALLFGAARPESTGGQLLFQSNSGQTASEYKWVAQSAGFELGIGDDHVSVTIPSSSHALANASSEPSYVRVEKPASENHADASFQIF